MRISISCPYCGIQNRVNVATKDAPTESKIVTCDGDIGGCDRDFVVRTVIHFESSAHKIEGEEKTK